MHNVLIMRPVALLCTEGAWRLTLLLLLLLLRPHQQTPGGVSVGTPGTPGGGHAKTPGLPATLAWLWVACHRTPIVFWDQWLRVKG